MGKVEDLYNKQEFIRPTTKVRIRPYVFRYLSYAKTMGEVGAGQQPFSITPQGDISAGNRVSWGQRIRVLKQNPAAAGTINFQGTDIIIPIGINELELIDSTKNAQGIDATEYKIFSVAGTFTVLVTEQILVTAEY